MTSRRYTNKDLIKQSVKLEKHLSSLMLLNLKLNKLYSNRTQVNTIIYFIIPFSVALAIAGLTTKDYFFPFVGMGLLIFGFIYYIYFRHYDKIAIKDIKSDAEKLDEFLLDYYKKEINKL